MWAIGRQTKEMIHQIKWRENGTRRRYMHSVMAEERHWVTFHPHRNQTSPSSDGSQKLELQEL